MAAAATSGSAVAALKASRVAGVMDVALLVFPKFTVLDLYGPIQAFAMASRLVRSAPTATASASATSSAPSATVASTFEPLFRLYTVAVAPGAVVSFEGPATVADVALCDLPALQPDVLVIPGGFGTRPLVLDAAYLAALRAAADAARVVATVCTGSALLAATGFLDGTRATSNNLSWQWVISVRKQVLWEKAARWISHVSPHTRAGVVTASGVSAGIDMTLDLIATLCGLEVAERSAQRMEYLWNRTSSDDPFLHSKL